MHGCLLSTPLLGTWPTTQARTLTGNRTHNPLVHRPALNPLSHTSQGLRLLFNKLLELPNSSKRERGRQKNSAQHISIEIKCISTVIYSDSKQVVPTTHQETWPEKTQGKLQDRFWEGLERLT